MTTELSARPTLPSELRSAASQIHALAVDGTRALRRPRRWQLALAVIWAAGIAGDAYTTLAMMGTGLYEEANALAAAGMDVVGPVAYALAASALCVGMATLSLGRPRGRYATLVWAALVLVALLKGYTALSNAALWLAG